MASGSGEKAGVGDGEHPVLGMAALLCQGVGGSRLRGRTVHMLGQLGALGLVGRVCRGTRPCTVGQALWA